MKTSRRVLIAAFAVFLGCAFLAARQKPAPKPSLKVFVSVDMEGISNVVHSDQTTPGTPEYVAARKWMAQDVNAAVQGAVEAGATEIVVNDSHGSMRNIDPGDLDPRAILISGSPKPLSMMQGIDASFQACLLIGYHAKAGTADAILDHTISGSVVRFVKVNGVEMPELGLNAAIAGAYAVPVVLVSGDAAVCRQAGQILGPDVVTVQVKEAIGRLAAKLVPWPESLRLIKEGTKAALGKRGVLKPFRPSSPTSFELGYHVSAQADMGAMIPGVTRLDARTLSFVADDYIQGFQKLRAMINIAPAR
ncbi:MAG TPA: M55 family metallopeptidase [Acidobacteriota bacterium]|nr:M55 family metallopeptidase [Acidobacteriota bacterium]